MDREEIVILHLKIEDYKLLQVLALQMNQSTDEHIVMIVESFLGDVRSAFKKMIGNTDGR